MSRSNEPTQKLWIKTYRAFHQMFHHLASVSITSPDHQINIRVISTASEKNKAESYSAPVSPGENAQFQVNITDADTGSKIATTKIEKNRKVPKTTIDIYTDVSFLFIVFPFFFLSLSTYLFFFPTLFFCLLEKANERPSSINNEQITEEETSSANTTSLSVSPSLSCVVFNLHNRYTIHIGCCCLFKAKQKETFAKVQSERPFSPPTRPPLYTNNSVDKSFQFS